MVTLDNIRSLPLPDGSPSLPSARGFIQSNPLHFAVSPADGRPVVLAWGAYAQVYELQETLWLQSSQQDRPAYRITVAKVFRERAPPDWEFVFHNEVATLQKLGSHERIVEFRGAVDRMPPTFVCGRRGCGATFQVERCPNCGERIYNGPPDNFMLQCSDGHRFRGDQEEHVRRMTAKRPCRHTEDCTCINFLFVPYIFLEKLDMDLRALGKTLAPGSEKARESTLSFSRVEKERQHQAALMKLACLVGFAEGLAHCHQKQQILVDIAPENIMVQFAASSVGRTRAIRGVKIIDPGHSRLIDDNRTSATPMGRYDFQAPEQTAAQYTAKVTLHFIGDVAREGEICRIEVEDGELEPELELRDIAADVNDIQFEVVDSSLLSAQQLGDLRSATSAGKTHSRVKYARLLHVPHPLVGPYSTTLKLNRALDIPADIYGLGCIIAWLFTGGNSKLVQLIRSHAEVATSRQEPVDAAFVEHSLGTDLDVICRALDLPDTETDDEIRCELLQVIFRCLVRAPEAYCRRRSSGYDHPAERATEDLKHIWDKLFLLQTTRGPLSSWHTKLLTDQQSEALDELRAAMAAEQARFDATLVAEQEHFDATLAAEHERFGATLTHKDRLHHARIRRMMVVTGMAGFGAVGLPLLAEPHEPLPWNLVARVDALTPVIKDLAAGQSPVIKPTGPSKPTEPKPNEPKPTESKPTEPKPTELRKPAEPTVVKPTTASPPPCGGNAQSVVMPSVEGQGIASAVNWLERCSLLVTVSGEGGHVTKQSPRPGKTLKKGSTVNLVVGVAKPPITAPSTNSR